jgi:hypothetical protein
LRRGKGYKAAQAFFRTGMTQDVPAVMRELRQIAKNAPPDVAVTARTLAKLIKGRENAIVTNGIL